MDHVHSEHVAATPDRLYAALADPGNLIRFVPQLTKVTAQEGDQVEIEARYDGHTQTGEAYFRADEQTRRIEWGTPSGYAGWMQVEPDDDGSMLTLSLHTTHVDHADHHIGATLEAIRMLAEADA